MKLGKAEVDALACPPGRKDRLVFDEDLDGFAVRVTAGGTKTFIFQYRRGEAVRRLTLGRYGQVTPAQARKLAEVARGEVAAGRDPVAEKRATLDAEAAEAARRRQAKAAAAYTLAHLIEAWEARQLAHRSDRYRREAARALRHGLSDLLALPADTITMDLAQRAIDAIPGAMPKPRKAVAKPGKAARPATAGKPPAPPPAAKGEAMARRTRAYGHALFAWGMGRRLVSANPFAATTVEGGETARERVLTEAELGEVWRAAGGLGWPWAPYLRFLLLTLQREAETAGLRWAELAEDFSTWELPAARTKNRRAHLVHLAEPARAILRGLAEGGVKGPRLASTGLASPFVFSTTGTTPLSGFAHAKARLDAAIVKARATAAAEAGGQPAPLVPWRLHDFRRTGVTVLAGLGVRWEVADKLLNHAHGAIRGVAAVYQRHDFLAERKAALDTWAEHVRRIGDGRAPAGNVVDLRPREAATPKGIC